MKIRAAVLDAIRAHAHRESPKECCGILIGAGEEIVDAIAAANVAEEPSTRYEVSPADHIAQIRRCRDAAGAGERRIVGVYHSHPHSGPVPSPTDLDQAYHEYVYVIAGPADGSAPMEIRAYRLSGERFLDVQLTRMPAADAD